MNTIFKKCNEEKIAVINPTDSTKAIKDFPEICISTFSKHIIDKFASKDGVTKIADLYSANGENPVYKIHYNGVDIAFYLSLVGAPACVCGFEEIVAMGAKKFVLFGSCGMLDNSIQNKLMIPTSAIRDEGTSYHYLPASDEIAADIKSVAVLSSCLKKYGYSFAQGKNWTTDAIYRETPNRIKERKQQGCITVEMELSAMLAVSQFRKIPFAQFLYTADSLDNNKWEIRDLYEHGSTKAEQLMTLAFECGIAL